MERLIESIQSDRDRERAALKICTFHVTIRIGTFAFIITRRRIVHSSDIHRVWFIHKTIYENHVLSVVNLSRHWPVVPEFERLAFRRYWFARGVAKKINERRWVFDGCRSSCLDIQSATCVTVSKQWSLNRIGLGSLSAVSCFLIHVYLFQPMWLYFVKNGLHYFFCFCCFQ